MPKRLERYIGADAGRVAERMARYGHCDWLVWEHKDGTHTARKSEASLIELIDAKPEWWYVVSADDAVSMKGFDWLANNMLAQAREGWF